MTLDGQTTNRAKLTLAVSISSNQMNLPNLDCKVVILATVKRSLYYPVVLVARSLIENKLDFPCVESDPVSIMSQGFCVCGVSSVKLFRDTFHGALPSPTLVLCEWGSHSGGVGVRPVF